MEKETVTPTPDTTSVPSVTDQHVSPTRSQVAQVTQHSALGLQSAYPENLQQAVLSQCRKSRFCLSSANGSGPRVTSRPLISHINGRLAGRQCEQLSGHRFIMEDLKVPLTPLPAAAQRHSSAKDANLMASQNAVLLGNTLSTSQTQVYLRAKMLLLSHTAPSSRRPVILSTSAQVQALTLRTAQALPVKTTPPSLKFTPPSLKAIPSPLKVTPPSLKAAPTPHIALSPHTLTVPRHTLAAQQCEVLPKAGKEDVGGPSLASNDPVVTYSSTSHQLPISPAPTLYSSVQSHPAVKQVLQYKSLHKGPNNPLIIPKPLSVHRRVPAKAILQATAQKALPDSQHCLIIGHSAVLTSPTSTTQALVQEQPCTTAVSSMAVPLVFSSATSQKQGIHGPLPHLAPSVSMTTTVSPSAIHVPSQSSPAVEFPPPLHLQGPVQIIPSGSEQKTPSQTPVLPLDPQTSSSEVNSSPSPPPVSPVSAAFSSPSPPSHQSSPGPSPTLKALQLLKALVQESEMIPRKRTLESSVEEVHPPVKLQAPPQMITPPSPAPVDLQLQPARLKKVSSEVHGGLCTQEMVQDDTTSSVAEACCDMSVLSSSSTVPSMPCTAQESSTPVLEPPRVPPSPESTLPQLPLRSLQCPMASLSEGPGRDSLQAIVRPQILTHLVEGFVIQEGLEPFPVTRSSLMVEHQGQLTDAQGVPRSDTGDMHMDVDGPGNSDTDDTPTEDWTEDKLLCEFCGKRGPPDTFLRSQRFCSLQCVRGFNMAYAKRINMLKANKMGHWAQRPDNKRRGRQQSAPDRSHGVHLRQQAPVNQSRTTTQRFQKEEVEGEEPPIPMTTRLRRQAEQDREMQARAKTTGLPNAPPANLPANPNLWTVDQVWAFVHTMPGCQDIADEFRLQEIDGQALMLLTEDHLVGAMKLKLGPALKIHARIGSLKGT